MNPDLIFEPLLCTDREYLRKDCRDHLTKRDALELQEDVISQLVEGLLAYPGRLEGISSDCPLAEIKVLWHLSEPAINGLESVLEPNLWAPIKALACRKLAEAGIRQNLCSYWLSDSSFNLPALDAFLETAWMADQDMQQFIQAFSTTEVNNWPRALASWRLILESEFILAINGANSSVLKTLEHSMVLLSDIQADEIPEREAQYLAARASSAFARLRLSQFRGLGRAPDLDGWQFLPDWETFTLQGYAAWQAKQYELAHNFLDQAVNASPSQSSPRLALATLLSEINVEQAIEVLEMPQPTRPVLTARSQLLARQGDYQQAEDILTAAASAPDEPLRYSYYLGRIQWQRQENRLRAAMAEWRGEWDNAVHFWEQAQADHTNRTLTETRTFFLHKRQLAALENNKAWRRARLEDRIEQENIALEKVPCVGDAQFFRALAVYDQNPDQTIKDLKALLRRRTWIDGEVAAGAARLLYISDLCMQLGLPDLALRIYGLLPQSEDLNLTQSIAAIYHNLLTSSSHNLASNLETAEDLGSEIPPVKMIVLIAQLLSGQISEPEKLDQANQKLGDLTQSILNRNTSDNPYLPDFDRSTDLHEILRAWKPTSNPIKELNNWFEDYMQVTEAKSFEQACPWEPMDAAWILITALLRDGNWNGLQLLAESLAPDVQFGFEDHFVLINLRLILNMAAKGELNEASRALQSLIHDYEHLQKKV